MQRNVGPLDRLVRGAVGVALLSLLVTAQSDARWFGLIGLVPLASALAGWCPAYALFGAGGVCRWEPEEDKRDRGK